MKLIKIRIHSCFNVGERLTDDFATNWRNLLLDSR